MRGANVIMMTWLLDESRAPSREEAHGGSTPTEKGSNSKNAACGTVSKNVSK